MKTLIFVFILILFLQTTVLQVNLFLSVLILRSFLRPEKQNLLLAFSLGLLLSFLNNSPLGLYSLLFLSLSEAAQIIAKSRLGEHILIAIGLVVVSQVIFNLFKPTNIIIEILFAIPLYFLVKFWEERFIIKSEIKLKI